MRNVAIFGQMYAGKSTLASALVDAGYVRLSFAGPLKNVASMAYGNVEKGRDYEITNLDGTTQRVSGRAILQGVGQSIKSLDRDFWLRCFRRDIQRYLDQPLVVDDGRFIFERDALRELGFLIVGVETPFAERMARAEFISGRRPSDEELEHQSEREIPHILHEVDITVSGTGDAYSEARRILEAAS